MVYQKKEILALGISIILSIAAVNKGLKENLSHDLLTLYWFLGVVSGISLLNSFKKKDMLFAFSFFFLFVSFVGTALYNSTG